MMTGKALELQVILWFLDSKCDVFTPVVDTNAMDAVLRAPATGEFIAIQIKGKDRSAANQGQIPNPVHARTCPFDYLIIYQEKYQRAVAIPRTAIVGRGKTFIFNSKDRVTTYPDGRISPQFRKYGIWLKRVPHDRRADVFIRRLSMIHRRLTGRPIV